MFSCEICKIFKNTILCSTHSVALSGTHNAKEHFKGPCKAQKQKGTGENLTHKQSYKKSLVCFDISRDVVQVG